jgi:hypothetical protein
MYVNEVHSKHSLGANTAVGSVILDIIDVSECATPRMPPMFCFDCKYIAWFPTTRKGHLGAGHRFLIPFYDVVIGYIITTRELDYLF